MAASPVRKGKLIRQHHSKNLLAGIALTSVRAFLVRCTNTSAVSCVSPEPRSTFEPTSKATITLQTGCDAMIFFVAPQTGVLVTALGIGLLLRGVPALIALTRRPAAFDNPGEYVS